MSRRNGDKGTGSVRCPSSSDFCHCEPVLRVKPCFAGFRILVYYIISLMIESAQSPRSTHPKMRLLRPSTHSGLAMTLVQRDPPKWFLSAKITELSGITNSTICHLVLGYCSLFEVCVLEFGACCAESLLRFLRRK